MSWFANLAYSRKLSLAFGIVVLVGMVPLAVSLRSLFVMRDALHRTAVESQEIAALHEAHTSLLRLHLAQNAHLRGHAPADLQASERLLATVQRSLDEHAKVADSADEVEEARELKEAVVESFQAFRRLAADPAAGDRAAAVAELDAQQAKLNAELTELVDEAHEEIREAQGDVEEKADEDTRATTAVGVGLGAGCLLFAIVVSLVFARGITRPIIELTTVAEKISLGETDVKVTTGRKDEIGQLADAFDRMVTAVRFLAADSAYDDRARDEEV